MHVVHRSVISLIAATVLLSAVPCAVADSQGIVIGGGAYYSQLDEDRGVLFNGTDKAFTGSLGWKFNDWLSIDAGYWDLGKYNSDKFGDGSRIDADVSAWSLGGIIGLPLGFIDLYLRGGVANWKADAGSIDDDGSDPYYGFGIGVSSGDGLQLYGEWVRFDIRNSIDTLGMGLRYTF